MPVQPTAIDAKIAAASRELPYSYDQVSRAVREAANFGVSTEDAVRGLRNVARSGMNETWSAYLSLWAEEAGRRGAAELEAMLPWHRRLRRRVSQWLRRAH